MEMKKAWTRPLTTVQQFDANEAISACGDSGVVYKFECNAPGGDVYYYPDSDGILDGTYTGSGYARYLGGYHPCNKKHEAEGTANLYDGFVDRNGNGICDNDNEKAIIWIERGFLFDNWHATANLDINTWETAKS